MSLQFARRRDVSCAASCWCIWSSRHFLAEAVGCAHTKPVVRGQSPERWIPLARLRREIRRDVEPILDATSKVGRKVEPAWNTTKDVTRKGLVIGGIIAAIGGLWWLDSKTAPYEEMFGPMVGTGNGSTTGN